MALYTWPDNWLWNITIIINLQTNIEKHEWNWWILVSGLLCPQIRGLGAIVTRSAQKLEPN